VDPVRDRPGHNLYPAAARTARRPATAAAIRPAHPEPGRPRPARSRKSGTDWRTPEQSAALTDRTINARRATRTACGSGGCTTRRTWWAALACTAGRPLADAAARSHRTVVGLPPGHRRHPGEQCGSGLPPGLLAVIPEARYCSSYAAGPAAAINPRRARAPDGVSSGLWAASHRPASVGALTRSSITCQTSLSSWFSFQIPYAVPSSTGGTATSPIAPLTAASTHSWPPRPMLS